MKVLVFMDKSAKLTALCRQSASNPVQAVISAAAAAVGSILHTYWRLLKSNFLFARDSHKVLKSGNENPNDQTTRLNSSAYIDLHKSST